MSSSSIVWSKGRAQEILSGGYWFGPLPEEFKRALLDRGEIRHYGRNSVIYRIGDAVDGMYAGLDGDLRAYAYGDANERVLLRLLGPRCWFGEFHLIDNYPTRTFEVRAHSDCAALFLSERNFHEISNASIDNYKQFIKLSCIHQRYLVRIAMEARSDAVRRTARALIRIAKMHGMATEAGVQITINITQADLANLIGVSRPYLNELISGWNAERFVSWKGSTHPVISVERLKTLLSPLDDWMLESEGWA